MSCLMCNELRHHHMCEFCNIFEPSSPSWHMLLTHMYLWTNHMCILVKHILVHLKLSLNYQNQKDLSIFHFLRRRSMLETTPSPRGGDADGRASLSLSVGAASGGEVRCTTARGIQRVEPHGAQIKGKGIFVIF